MALFDTGADNLEARNADFEAVNGSATFIFMVAVVAIVVAVPLAIFF